MAYTEVSWHGKLKLMGNG